MYRTTRVYTPPAYDWVASLYTHEEAPTLDTWVYPEYKTEYTASRRPTDDAAHHRLTALLANTGVDRSYTTFHIPKRTGGMRRIDAPSESLKENLRRIKDLLEERYYLHPHNAAFAYVERRSVKHAMQVHQKNGSMWFLKLDLKDFFPSHTIAVLVEQLRRLDLPESFPFTELANYAVLDGKLPQGSPLSPLLSNLACVSLDFELEKRLAPNHVYTRYADDILISSRVKFNKDSVMDIVRQVLHNDAPHLTINEAKTRFGSCAGRNWNLGLMYNKDKDITVGHKKKERLRAGLNNFLSDFTNGRIWGTMDAQVLRGQLEHFKYVEPEYAEQLIQKYSTKYNINFYEAYRRVVNS